MPRRIQLSRKKGWRLPDGAVSVARPGPLGNPFVIGSDHADVLIDLANAPVVRL
jgi:hypothetical protein